VFVLFTAGQTDSDMREKHEGEIIEIKDSFLSHLSTFPPVDETLVQSDRVCGNTGGSQ